MKNVIAFGFMFALASSANASYLCWQVNATDTGMSDVQAWAEQQGKNWDTAKITIKDGSGHTVSASLYNYAFYETENYATAVDTSPVQINLGVLDGTTSGYSYFIEMINSGSTTKLGQQAGTYADLAASVYENAIPIDNIEQMQAKAWHGSSAGYKAAPEPTSAMLMLLGVAGLALRRKQRKIA